METNKWQTVAYGKKPNIYQKWKGESHDYFYKLTKNSDGMSLKLKDSEESDYALSDTSKFKWLMGEKNGERFFFLESTANNFIGKNHILGTTYWERATLEPEILQKIIDKNQELIEIREDIIVELEDGSRDIKKTSQIGKIIEEETRKTAKTGETEEETQKRITDKIRIFISVRGYYTTMGYKATNEAKFPRGETLAQIQEQMRKDYCEIAIEADKKQASADPQEREFSRLIKKEPETKYEIWLLETLAPQWDTFAKRLDNGEKNIMLVAQFDPEREVGEFIKEISLKPKEQKKKEIKPLTPEPPPRSDAQPPQSGYDPEAKKKWGTVTPRPTKAKRCWVYRLLSFR